MILNSLFLYQKLFTNINKQIKLHSSFYKGCNFTEYIKSHSHLKFHNLLESEISHHKINCLFILLDNCDASLDLLMLNQLKDKYKLLIIFIFKNSQNSFEHIDRYYAQISCLTIIDDIPFIGDFYKMLEIPTYTLINNCVNKEILTHNIFSSELSNLSIIPHQTYTKRETEKSEEEQFQEIFSFIKESQYTQNKLLIDEKFFYAQTIYKIFWELFSFFKENNLEVFRFENIQYYKEIFLLYKAMKNHTLDTTTPLEIINKTFYKEYSL